MVRHALFCHDRLLEHRETKQTSYEKRTGRKYDSKMILFGEPVWFKRPGDTRTKFQMMWSPGIWLGRRDESDEHLIGTRFGTLSSHWCAGAGVHPPPSADRLHQWQGHRGPRAEDAGLLCV